MLTRDKNAVPSANFIRTLTKSAGMTSLDNPFHLASPSSGKLRGFKTSHLATHNWQPESFCEVTFSGNPSILISALRNSDQPPASNESMAWSSDGLILVV